MTLRLDWCSFEAAKFAVTRWHYSKSMPAGKLTRVGVWEDESFIGVVLFGRGAAINIASVFGLAQTEVVELVRVALTKHKTEVSRILAIAVRMFRKLCPGVRLVVSFADSAQGHHGGIYQAAGWTYIGDSVNDTRYVVHGETVHPKVLYSRYGKGGQSIPWLRANVDPRAEVVVGKGQKRKYAIAFDDAAKAVIEALKKPYPKKIRGESKVALHLGSPLGEGGSIPTSPLQEKRSQ